MWVIKALVLYKDGERKYIIAPKGVVAGQEIIASEPDVLPSPPPCG
jgi:large subunit ribosomal protein L2